MKRLLPQSLAGQMIALTLIAIIIAQIIGFMIFADERRYTLQSAAHQQVLAHTSSIVRMLSLAPDNIHSKIIESVSVDGFQLSLEDEPLVKNKDKRRSEKILQRHFKGVLNEYADKVRIQIYRDYKGWLHSRDWMRHWDDDDDHDDEEYDHDDDDHDHDALDSGDQASLSSIAEEKYKLNKYKRNNFQQEFSISILLNSGRWLNVESHVAPPSKLWALPSLIAMLVTAIALIAILIIMMRRVTKPMAELAAAAEGFGRGETTEKLLSWGPQDVRKATDAFNLMQERLARFVKDRTEMLASISHDLRTPITSLRIRAEFIEDVSLRNEMLVTISEMQLMVEATLAFAKQDANQEKSIATDIYALLDSIVVDVRDLGAEISLHGDLGVVLMCRPLSIKRVFRNLIENAVRYGGIVKIKLHKSQKNIIITIEDDGPGVDAEKLDKIFEPFYRLDESRNTENGSVGLGLSISKTIIHAHGGEICADNITPHGLCVKVKFPS